MRKPKTGLLLLTAEWFIQVGASQGSFSELPIRLEQDAVAIENALTPSLDIINPGVLSNSAQVDAALKEFIDQDIDALIICYITWGEDRFILKAVERLPITPSAALVLYARQPIAKSHDHGGFVPNQRSGGRGAVQWTVKTYGKKVRRCLWFTGKSTDNQKNRSFQQSRTGCLCA